MSEIADLQALLREFADRRDWHRFHTPKNLAMAVAGEAGELVAEFQWLTAEESAALREDPPRLHAIAEEMADVAIYLLRLADVLNVDIRTAIREKIAQNEKRFPAQRR